MTSKFQRKTRFLKTFITILPEMNFIILRLTNENDMKKVKMFFLYHCEQIESGLYVIVKKFSSALSYLFIC